MIPVTNEELTNEVFYFAAEPSPFYTPSQCLADSKSFRFPAILKFPPEDKVAFTPFILYEKELVPLLSKYLSFSSFLVFVFF